MITAIIVWSSLIAGGIFCVAYFLSPRLRKQVEQPKYQFHQQVQDFDKKTTQAAQKRPQS